MININVITLNGARIFQMTPEGFIIKIQKTMKQLKMKYKYVLGMDQYEIMMVREL